MFRNKNFLITGGTGSFGHAFIRKIIKFRPPKIIVYSRDEFKQSEMAREFDYEGMRFILGDIRDKERLARVISGMDINYIVHAAALKQVPMLEYNPTEAVQTNINGAVNIIESCNHTGVERVINLSTDKAVNPINLYGATKLCAEKIFTAANAYTAKKTIFASVRYGNVIGSRASVIPFFQKLKEQKIKTFPITDERMTRFWITLEQAVDTVLRALEWMEGGEIFIPRLPSMKVVDVARAIDADCDIKIIGIRPGEKLHETLVSEDNKNVWFIDGEIRKKATDIFSSNTNDKWMTINELRTILCFSDGKKA